MIRIRLKVRSILLPYFNLSISPPPLSAIHGYQLCPMEHALSITSCPLGAGDSQQVYYIVGTAFVNHMEREPTQGRVLVLEVTEGQLPVHLILNPCVSSSVEALKQP